MYNSVGNLVWQADLDIYGKVRTLSKGNINDCPFRYQGQYDDTETGLYYNRFRYYSPESGMYMSQDPKGLKGTNPNLYAYTSNSNAEVDPFGLDCKKFYSVQGKADAKRIKNGGTPWPDEPHRAHLGDGIYSWDNREGAEKYFELLSKRTDDLEIVEFTISESDFEKLNKFHVPLDDDLANEWLGKHSRLYGDGTPHNYDYVRGNTGMGHEHYFSKNIYHLLRF